MAEICCEVVSGTETTTDACEAGSRAARRRRMQLRRIRPVSGVEAMASPAEALPLRKRHRLEASPSGGGICRRDLVGSGMEPPVEGGGEASSNVNLGRDPRESLGESKASESPMPRYGMTLVCGRRREMEDAVSVRPDFAGGVVNGRYHFYGVFDGHGCSHVAVSCRDRMHEMVAEELEKMESELTASPDWEDAMRRSFSRMDAEVGDWRGKPRAGTCRCDVRTLNCDHVGSTAVVAVVTSKQIVVANCGDSRAVLCRGRAAVPVSTDHKPDRVDEMERIQAAGGRVIYWDGARVLGVLAMSRAIGDAYLKPFVISEPEVTITERDVDDECLILASDGLWDVVSNQMACDIARMCLQANGRESERGADAGAGAGENTESGSDRACSDAAMLLTKLALARHSADNVSVVVIDLKRR